MLSPPLSEGESCRLGNGYFVSFCRTRRDLELGTNELGVGTALTQQFLVRADSRNPSAFEHDDPVGVAHRRETMGNHDGRAASH